MLCPKYPLPPILTTSIQLKFEDKRIYLSICVYLLTKRPTQKLPPRKIDTSFDPGQFLKSKASTLCRIFMAALTGQTICNVITADIHVRWYPPKKDLNIDTQGI
ncbi:hypothetical protein TNCV_3946511 [Trichonephila clavipes]|nr:hypothetical protein TNCV_3946511 [Trichonephila clavipes]